MTASRDVEQAAPEFAQRVQALFDAHKHKKWPGEVKVSGRAIPAGPSTEGPEGDQAGAGGLEPQCRGNEHRG